MEANKVHVLIEFGDDDVFNIIGVFSDEGVAMKLMERLGTVNDSAYYIRSGEVDGYEGRVDGPIAFEIGIIGSRFGPPYYYSRTDVDAIQLEYEGVRCNVFPANGSWYVWVWADDLEDARKKAAEAFANSPHAEEIALLEQEIRADRERLVGKIESALEDRSTPLLAMINGQPYHNISTTQEWGMVVNDPQDQDDVEF